MKAVALFGGTFNPIHFGHLAVAEEVRSRHGLDKVIFVPSCFPPHKDAADLADAGQRLVMAHMATVSNPAFEVSAFEVEKGGKSYTIDTVRHFTQVLGPGTKVHFIVGADMLAEISRWKDIGGLLGLCRFIAVPRPGYDAQKILDQYFLASENLPVASELLENILIEDIGMLDISATQIRKRVKEWKSIKYLVPEAVEQFIHHQQLYL